VGCEWMVSTASGTVDDEQSLETVQEAEEEEDEVEEEVEEEEEEEEVVDPTTCDPPCCYATDASHPAAMKCLEIGDAEQFCKQQRTSGCAWMEMEEDDSVEEEMEDAVDTADDDDDEQTIDDDESGSSSSSSSEQQDEVEEPLDPTTCDPPCCYATDATHPMASKCIQIGDAELFCKREREIGCAWMEAEDVDTKEDAVDTEGADEEEEEADGTDAGTWDDGWCFASDPTDAAAVKCYEIGNDKTTCHDQQEMGCAWMNGNGEPEDWNKDEGEEEEEEGQIETVVAAEYADGWCYAADINSNVGALGCFEIGGDKVECRDHMEMGCAWMNGKGEPEEWDARG